MSEKICSVYCHTNKINGKKYIGITSRPVEKRWAQGRAYRHNSHFTNAIKKYGWNNFEHEVLAEGLKEDVAKDFERMMIFMYHTTDPTQGYNQSIGGEPMSGIKHSAETKRKMSEAAKQRVVSDETKRKLSEIMTNRPQELKDKFAHSHDGMPSWNKGLCGPNNPLYGRKHTEDRKKHVAEARMRHFIRYIPTGEIFRSNREAMQKTGVKPSKIFSHCIKKVKHPEWEYVNKEATT